MKALAASRAVKASSWLSIVAAVKDLPEIWAQVVQEIKDYASLEPGWRGPGTQGVSKEIESEAVVLARLFAVSLPDGSCPMVGADDDGFVVMTWNDRDLVGNLSVNGDGTYTYYFQRKDQVLKKARAQIFEPLTYDLVSFLKV